MIIALIVLGSIIMVGNIIAYARFIHSSSDIMLSASRGEPMWEVTGLLLLIFFLIGYIGVALFQKPDILIACILFFGAIFVSLAVGLMYYLVDTVKKRSMAISQTLISVLDKRDPNLNGHSIHVKNLCVCLYKHTPSQMKEGIAPTCFEYAALFHDAGKLGIPESILNKPGKLTDVEWDIMKQHPKIGVELLKSLPFFDIIKDWILYHHERIDGNGYYGLPGNEIPTAAKMIAICDTYSAITMRRSYKYERSHEEAMEIIHGVAGTQLDPQLVSVFINIPKKEILDCAPLD